MKKYIFNYFLPVFAGILLISSSGYSAISAKDIIKKVKKTYNKIKTLKVEFEQSSEWQLAGTSHSVNGNMQIKDEVKFRIEMPDIVTVSDGKNIWNYSKSTNQVIINRVKKSDTEQLPAKLLLQYSERYEPKLLAEETFQNKICYALELTSKTGDDFIQKMKILVDKKTWYTQKVEQFDIHGTKKIFIIKSIRTNFPIDNSIFTYITPPGVEVIDMR